MAIKEDVAHITSTVHLLRNATQNTVVFGTLPHLYNISIKSVNASEMIILTIGNTRRTVFTSIAAARLNLFHIEFS